jgi:hypothetical protein
MVNMEEAYVDAMIEGVPYSRYRKTILGKVFVVRLDPFSDKPETQILAGDPNNPDDDPTTTVELWTKRQDLFFRRVHTKHFEAGRLAKLANEVPIEDRVSPNQLSDEELEKLMTEPFFTMKSRLETFTDIAPVFRILNKARECDKSEKFIKHIEAKMSELQGIEYGESPKE